MRDLTEEEQISAAQAVADVSDRIEIPLEVALTPDAAEARAALPRHPEWGTFALILACYLVWGGALFGLAQVSHLLAVLLAGGWWRCIPRFVTRCCMATPSAAAV